MGSNSKGKDGEGTSGVTKPGEIENYEQELNFLQTGQLLQNELNNGISDPMVHIPPYGSRAYVPPSQMITTQVHIAPSQRIGVVAQPQPQPQPQPLQQDGYIEYVLHERLKQVKISWNHTGRNVAIVGSWDNWVTTEPLQNVGQSFVIIKILPVGIYHYRFVVDGYLTYAPEFPWACDDSGCTYNTLDLQEYIPEAHVRLSDFEPPPSPPSSYDNIFLNEDEFSKPPPELPPQLPVTMREEPSSSNDHHPAILRHTHVELNHLYIHKDDSNSFVALRSTHRFREKLVTILLYKPARRER